MKLKIITLFAFCISLFSFSQSTYSHGNLFDFNKNFEKDVQLVPGGKDSYYMHSRINEDNYAANNIIIVRQFDNNNDLKQTFSHEMPQLEKFAYVNYLGSFDSGNKIVFISETYVGKLKKKDIYKIIFDKVSGTFKDELLESFPIESVMKSGTTKFEKSENGRFGAIVFYEHSPRKESAKINIHVIETGSLKTAWKKQVIGEPTSYDTHFFVANSGNVGLLRVLKENAFLQYVTASSEEEKLFTEKMKIANETVVNIGSKEYLLAFNSTSQTFKVNGGKFDQLMLFDIEEGKIIGNDATPQYYRDGKILEVLFPYITVSGDKIYAFTENIVAIGKKQIRTPMGGSMDGETIYHSQNPNMVIINYTTGKLEAAQNVFPAISTDMEHHSLGIVNIKGNFYVKNTSVFNLDKINLDTKELKQYQLEKKSNESAERRSLYSSTGNVYSQAVLYRPETNTLHYPRNYPESKSAAIVSIDNF